jgi:hypothetical protein
MHMQWRAIERRMPKIRATQPDSENLRAVGRALRRVRERRVRDWDSDPLWLMYGDPKASPLRETWANTYLPGKW